MLLHRNMRFLLHLRVHLSRVHFQQRRVDPVEVIFYFGVNSGLPSLAAAPAPADDAGDVVAA